MEKNTGSVFGPADIVHRLCIKLWEQKKQAQCDSAFLILITEEEIDMAAMAVRKLASEIED